MFLCWIRLFILICQDSPVTPTWRTAGVAAVGTERRGIHRMGICQVTVTWAKTLRIRAANADILHPVFLGTTSLRARNNCGETCKSSCPSLLQISWMLVWISVRVLVCLCYSYGSLECSKIQFKIMTSSISYFFKQQRGFVHRLRGKELLFEWPNRFRVESRQLLLQLSWRRWVQCS